MPPLILVVDDEPLICELLTDLLSDEGYRIACAADGREALDQVARALPDLVVSDLSMPRVNGVEFIRRLRALGHAIPVVLLSAYRVPGDLPDVRLISKPFDHGRFVAIVGTLLDEKAA